MAKMDEDSLKSLVAQEIRQSYGYLGGRLSNERTLALRYYFGYPYGDEEDDRSQVITREVMETVEAALPLLIKSFVSTDKMFEFEPAGEGDEEAAKQATDYVNLIYNKDNDGFLLTHDVIKDALLMKNGFVKHWWEEKEDTKTESYTGLTLDQITVLLSDDGVELVNGGAQPAPTEDQAALAGPPQPMPDGSMAPTPAVLFDVTIKRTQKIGRERLVAVPPEEFLINRRARSIKESPFVGHRRRATISELIVDMGLPRAKVQDLPTDDGIEDWTLQEAITRRAVDDENMTNDYDTQDGATRSVWITEGWIRCDWNGDGKAVMRRVIVAGDGDTMLLNEDWDDDQAPFVDARVNIITHHFFGMSVADQMGDLQYISSTLHRQALDNMYQANNNRMEIPETAIGDNTIEDALNNRPGGLIRTKQGGQLQMLPPAPIGELVLPIIERLKDEVQSRTGIVPFHQALDPDTLQGTATGQNMAASALQERVQLMARILALTCFRNLGRAILKDVTKHQDAPRMIRLRGKWVPMDPRSWNADMDVSCNVGLGTGTKSEQELSLMRIASAQKEILAAGNYGGLVTPEKVFNVLEEVVEHAGFPSADRYFVDPREAQAHGQQQPQQKPDPATMKAQAEIEIQKAQAAQDAQSQQIRMQAEQQQAQHQAQIDQLELQGKLELQRQKQAGEMALNQQRFAAEMAIQSATLLAKYGPDIAPMLQGLGLPTVHPDLVPALAPPPAPDVRMPA